RRGGEMGKINWSRVFLGGLAGGIVVFVVDFIVNGAILGKQWQAADEKLGHPPSARGLIGWFMWGLLGGLFLPLFDAPTPPPPWPAVCPGPVARRQSRPRLLVFRLRSAHDRCFVVPHFSGSPAAYQRSRGPGRGDPWISAGRTVVSGTAGVMGASPAGAQLNA